MRKELQSAVSKTMTTAIYARFSSSNQSEMSIEGQLRECKEYAQKYGFTIVAEYIDRAKSATTDNRPDFQRMIQDALAHKFRYILCWKTDRFARNRYDAATYKKQLSKAGIRVLYAKEDIPDNALGVLQLGILETLDEYYSAALSENIKRGYYDAALNHKYLGSRSLGYRKSADGKYEIDPVEAEVVRRIFREYKNGLPIHKIIEGLNRDGFRTAQGKEFKRASLATIIKNERYIGVYALGTIYREEGVIPPIIDKALFDEVQTLHKQKKRPCVQGDTDYILTTKLFCGHCGEPMTGESAQGKTQLYHYYTCTGKKRRTCNKKRVRKEEIEDLVIRNVTETLCDDKFVSKTIDDFMEFQAQDDSELKALNASLKDVRKAKENILKAIEQGIFTSSTKDRLIGLEARENDLVDAIARHEVKAIPRSLVEFFFQQIRSGDIKDSRFQKKLLDLFVDKIFLYDDHMTIAYRMGDKTGTITYDEVRSVDVSLHHNSQTRTTFHSKWLIVSYQIKNAPPGGDRKGEQL